MKKKLNTDAIMSELGESVFFQRASKPEQAQDETPQPSPAAPAETEKPDTVIPRYHDTMVSSNHDTVIPSNHDTMPPEKRGAVEAETEEEIYEIVRKAVKRIGKEAATHRFTWEEKQQLAEIEYAYKRQGIRTSENEITRIAINYFIEDYRKLGEQSLLAKILKYLRE